VFPPPPHYEPCQDFLLQGDIGYFPFVQLVAPTEATALPSADMSNQRGVPAFEGMGTTPISIDGRSYLLRHWAGLGMVIDHTSELRNSEADSRVTVAPIVDAGRSGFNWAATMTGEVVGAMPLPACGMGGAVAGMPERDMPELVVLPRTVVGISRRIAHDGRMMTLTPPMAAFLAAKLSQMYAERQWARMIHVDNVIGHSLVEVLDVEKPDGPPSKGRWAVLNFANHERLQVWLHYRD
jgi:hypothetical protein